MKTTLSNILLAALAVWMIPEAAAAGLSEKGGGRESCLYQESKPVKLPGVLASVKGEDSTSFFLRGGIYVNLVDWSCSRLGRRIFIVVPRGEDAADYINDLLVKISDLTVARGVRRIMKLSFEREEFSTTLNIQGFEMVSYSVRRTDYESEYVITYYTVD